MRHLALVFLLLTACSKSDPHAASAETAKKERTVAVDAALVRDKRIVVSVAERRPVAGFIVATGEVEAPPDAAAALTAPVSARVREVFVRRGDVVKKGDRLATLSAGEVARITSDLGRAKARRTHAERVLAQEEKLAAQNATSERALSDAKSAVDSAKADERAAATLLSNFGAARGAELVLTSPIDGTVVRVDGSVGAPVEATAPLFRIVDPRRFEVRADVAESDADEVPEKARVVVTSSSKSTVCGGSVDTHAPHVEVKTRTVPFRVKLGAECGEFHESAFVDVSIERAPRGDEARLVALPRDAVVSIEDVPFVFLATEKTEVFKPKSVRVHEYGGPLVYLEDGVGEGERVVSEGALLLKGELLRARLE